MKKLAPFIFLVFTAASFADAINSFGIGAAAVGSAGAGSALVHDWTATYYNLAGLAAPRAGEKVAATETRPGVRIRRSGQVEDHSTAAEPLANREPPHHQFGIGYLHQVPIMQVNLNDASRLSKQRANDATSDLDYGLVQAGFVFDLRQLLWTPYDVPIRLGFLASLSADGTVSNAPQLSEKVYSFKNLGANTQVISSVFALGFQVWKERLSIGVSPGASTAIKGNAEISDITLDDSKPVRTNAKVNLNSKPAPMAAVMYRQPLSGQSNLWFSLVFRSEVLADSDLAVRTHLPVGLTSESETITSAYVKPETWRIGAAYEFQATKTMLDVEWQRYSRFQVSSARASYEDDFAFNDVLSVRLGAEAPLRWFFTDSDLIEALDLTVRSGYGFVPSFTPDQTRRANHLDNDKHIFAFGLSRLFASSAWLKYATKIDWGFQYQWWRTRATNKNIADTLVDGSLQPNYRYGGHVLITSLSLSWVF